MAAAESPKRAGLTYEVGVAVGHVRVTQSYVSSSSFEEVAAAPLVLGVGGFVHPDVAVLFRSTTALLGHERGALPSRLYFEQFLGASAQVWLRDNFAASGRVGGAGSRWLYQSRGLRLRAALRAAGR